MSAWPGTRSEAVNSEKQFLRVPPFPGAAARLLAFEGDAVEIFDDTRLDRLLDQIEAARVGGTYWGAQPPLGSARRSLWLGIGLPPSMPDGHYLSWPSGCDPWHQLDGASELVCDAGNTLRIIAGLKGVKVRDQAQPPNAAQVPDRHALRQLLRTELESLRFVDPFSGNRCEPEQVVALCGLWRTLIDSNRDIAGIYGFAGWKRTTTAPLLWAGDGKVPFDRKPKQLAAGAKVVAWPSRMTEATKKALQQSCAVMIEAEDGFIRSAGLGANCVPPLSIVIDPHGAHFDPACESALERLLEQGDFSPELLERARRLRIRIVALGLSKYDVGTTRLERRSERRHLLVTGQVEDDRAVLSALGEVLTNAELLRRARAAAPDAQIIYKPHPDVEAGHRAGAVPDTLAMTLADEVVRDQSISALLDLVDELHVNTSLAGFEALMRGKAVTTHGVPFYAGWGLTRDLALCLPDARSSGQLDELVAASLILYPRYVDPVTGLPCPIEVVINRLAEPTVPTRGGALVPLRRLQGRLKQMLGFGGGGAA